MKKFLPHWLCGLLPWRKSWHIQWRFRLFRLFSYRCTRKGVYLTSCSVLCFLANTYIVFVNRQTALRTPQSRLELECVVFERSFILMSAYRSWLSSILISSLAIFVITAEVFLTGRIKFICWHQARLTIFQSKWRNFPQGNTVWNWLYYKKTKQTVWIKKFKA